MASLIKRRNTYYLQDRFGGRIKRTSLRTDCLQIAKEKLRQYESAKMRGLDSPLPTRTPIGQVVEAYVQHIRTVKTAKSAQTDIYYLREAFGPCCEAVQITSRRPSPLAKKRPPRTKGDGRCREHHIETSHFEAITTADVQGFIDGRVRSRGLAPKTANRYREILCRLFNWSMKQGLVRLPGGINPVLNVERHKEKAPEIRFLTLAQIDEQLLALRFKPQLQTMVATLIYAGLRREELLWLTHDDIDLSRRHGGQGLIRVRAKTIAGRFWQPKTKRNRAVPISKALREYLDRYTPPQSDHGWYFPSPMGMWWDPDGFSQELRTSNNEFQLIWSCLDYRHTFGSQLAQNGVSLYKIAHLLGNSPIICSRHYSHLSVESLTSDVTFSHSTTDSITAC